MCTALCVDERRIGAPFCTEFFYVNLAGLYLWLYREARALNQQFSVFKDQRITAKHHILS